MIPWKLKDVWYQFCDINIVQRINFSSKQLNSHDRSDRDLTPPPPPSPWCLPSWVKSAVPNPFQSFPILTFQKFTVCGVFLKLPVSSCDESLMKLHDAYFNYLDICVTGLCDKGEVASLKLRHKSDVNEINAPSPNTCEIVSQSCTICVT